MITAEVIALFVRFVRLNPDIPPDAPVMLRTFFTYADLADADIERDDFAGGATG